MSLQVLKYKKEHNIAFICPVWILPKLWIPHHFWLFREAGIHSFLFMSSFLQPIIQKLEKLNRLRSADVFWRDKETIFLPPIVYFIYTSSLPFHLSILFGRNAAAAAIAIGIIFGNLFFNKMRDKSPGWMLFASFSFSETF